MIIAQQKGCIKS